MSDTDQVTLQGNGAEPSLTNKRAESPNDVYSGYDRLSLIIHWLTVLSLVPLALLGGGVHVAIGIIVAPLLLMRIGWRLGRGFPRVCDQPVLLNFIERMAIIVMLLALVLICLSGLLLPAARGVPYPLFGIAEFSLPWDGSAGLSDWLVSLHAMSVSAFVGSLAIHLLSAVRHTVTRTTGILVRIVKPVAGGK